jgi:hypothetical protein
MPSNAYGGFVHASRKRTIHAFVLQERWLLLAIAALEACLSK